MAGVTNKYLCLGLDKAINFYLRTASTVKNSIIKPTTKQSSKSYDIYRIIHNPESTDDDVKFKLESLDDLGGLTKAHLTFRSPIKTDYEENNLVHVKYYTPKQPKGAVNLIHGLKEGFFIFDRLHENIAKEFAKYDYSTLLMDLPYHRDRTPKKTLSGELMLSLDLNRSLEAFMQAVVDTRCCINYLSKDNKNVALAGESLGAIIALLASNDNRVKACASIIGGSDLYTMLFEGMTLRGFANQLENAVGIEKIEKELSKIDPAVHLEPTDKVLMINGIYDQVIPRKCVDKLADKLQHIKRIDMETGHFSLIFKSKEIAKHCAEFFKERFT